MASGPKILGPALVAAAAILWATDAPFRLPMIRAINPIWVVLFEHLLATIALIVWMLLRKERLLTFRRLDWILAAVLGIGGSALGTVLFSASFSFISPSLAILLQKLQPVFVVVLAYLFLGERPKSGFYPWAAVALTSAVVLSFPDFDFSFLRGGMNVHSRGVIYAFTASLLWAVATIVGKRLLKRNSPGTVTFWRYVFGLTGLAVLVLASGAAFPAAAMNSRGNVETLIYMSLVPGLLALVAYYAGLARTPASTTALIELLYPVAAVILNTLFIYSPLNPVQLGAGVVLLFAITKISLG